MATPVGLERARAARIRAKIKVGAAVTPEDLAWLSDYEETQKKNRTQDIGASASASRKVSYTEEEHQAAAVGTGAAAEVAAAAAMVREEGKRLDSLTTGAVAALQVAVNTYKGMVEQLLNERKQDAALHRTLLVAVREEYIGRSEAEGELIKTEAAAEAQAALAANGGNGIEAMLVQALISKGFNVSAPEQTNVNNGKKPV